MRNIVIATVALSALVALGCAKKEEPPAKIEGTPAATSAPITGAPGQSAGISYESRMPASVKGQLQTKGAPIK